MSDEIKVNGYDVVISVEHITEPGEGWQGSEFVAECHSLEEVSRVINDPKNQPDQYWLWKIDFQDKVIDNASE